MTDLLIVVDMQRDFVSGALGSEQARAIVPAVAARIRQAKVEQTQVAFTLDTHEPDYLNTREGRFLPVPHCIKGSHGWEVCPALEPLRTGLTIDKPTFGSAELGRLILELDAKEPVGSITLVGLCTDICVISNAMIAKAFLPEVPVTVDAACCAGVTPESHRNALNAMKMCQVRIENE